jgi:phosphatidylglycerophosphate synthase
MSAIRGRSSYPPPRPLRSTFKPRDVEELVDYWINRPIAALLVAALAPLPVTPNQVTVASGVVGLFAGIVIGTAPLESTWQVPLGGLLLFFSILLDCADGQLARLRGQSSMVGRMLDGCVDVVPTAAVFLGFCVYLNRAGYDLLTLNAIGWSAGYSLKWHVHSYDHAKNVYLANVLPPAERSKALPTYAEIARERDLHLERGDWFGALVLRAFMSFTKTQRGGWQQERMGLGRPGARSDEERSLYREQFREVMRLWTWNGLATHLSLFLVAAALTPFFHSAALYVWLFILGPMNLITLYLRSSERTIERDVQAQLGLARR